MCGKTVLSLRCRAHADRVAAVSCYVVLASCIVTAVSWHLGPPCAGTLCGRLAQGTCAEICRPGKLSPCAVPLSPCAETSLNSQVVMPCAYAMRRERLGAACRIYDCRCSVARFFLDRAFVTLVLEALNCCHCGVAFNVYRIRR